jgi:hypothetical protein
MIYGAARRSSSPPGDALSFSLGAILGFTAAVVGGWIDQLHVALRRSDDGDPDADLRAGRAVGAAAATLER